jgi:hypothetical protein
MRPIGILPVLAACALAVVAGAAMEDAELGPPVEAAALPDAAGLMDSVIRSLPVVPVTVRGQIVSRKPGGGAERTLNVEMRLDWHGRTPSAKYTIRDAFGDNLSGLNIRWPEPGRQEFRYFRGDSLVGTPLDDLYERVEGTDISWADLSLAFLWWEDGKTVGAERVKGRFCYIVDLPAPSGRGAAYAGVRLWIDPQIHILLRAMAYDGAGQAVKLLEVKSFRKVGNVWVVQNLDVQSLPGRHKTTLRVREAEYPGSEKDAPKTRREPAPPA